MESLNMNLAQTKADLERKEEIIKMKKVGILLLCTLHIMLRFFHSIFFLYTSLINLIFSFTLFLQMFYDKT